METNELHNRKVDSSLNNVRKDEINKEQDDLTNAKSELESFYDAFSILKPLKNSYYLTRVVLVRFLAFIYIVAFSVAYNQNKELLGKNGLKPANKYMERIYASNNKGTFKYEHKNFDNLSHKFNLFMQLPTLYWFFDWYNDIDFLLLLTSSLGLILSIFVFINGMGNFFIMTTLWLLYHSIVNIGQTWYSFGWESQLLESGFIAMFMVPFMSLRKINPKSPPSFVTILLYRWLIFRIMLGAGLIKIRGDKCWMDLTCMNYHYETQPVPNPLSYFMHKEPEFFHKFEVLANHFVELLAPFLILLPFRPMRLAGGLIQVLFQVLLIISGNLSFLNWLTILPSLACFDDHFYALFFKKNVKSTLGKLLKIQYFMINKDSSLNFELSRKKNLIMSRFRIAFDLLLLSLVAYLSMPVVLNLVSSKQAMNTSFEPFRLVNTYGAFGSVTKERHEVIFQGTLSDNLNEANSRNTWIEYEFKCKPGNVNRRPCIITPYHYRLDWLMWFAAFQTYEYNPWLLSMSAKFLLNDKNFTSQMIAYNPFENSNQPPKYIKADLYLYKYSPYLTNSSSWWTRKYVRSYIPPITLKHLEAYINNDLGWDLKLHY